jgi:hypothetical protein
MHSVSRNSQYQDIHSSLVYTPYPMLPGTILAHHTHPSISTASKLYQIALLSQDIAEETKENVAAWRQWLN